MHHEPECTDGGKRDEPQRQDTVEQLVEQQAGELRQHQDVELAAAGLALAEGAGKLVDPQVAAADRRISSRILKPCAVSFGASASRRGWGSMKKPLIGSVTGTGRSRWARRMPLLESVCRHVEASPSASPGARWRLAITSSHWF